MSEEVKEEIKEEEVAEERGALGKFCLLYTSDAADE